MRRTLGQTAATTLASEALAALEREVAAVRGEASAENALQVSFDSLALSRVAERLAYGAAAPYLSPPELARARSLAEILANVGAPAAAAPRDEAMIRHAEDHVGAVMDALVAAELAVVGEEAPGVPVSEPAERGPSVPVALAAAGAVVALIVILGG